MFNRSTLSRGAAVLAAVFAVSALPGAAIAAVPRGADDDSGTTTTRPTHTRPNWNRVVEVEAGATGDGPADQEECNHYADIMNRAIKNLKQAWVDGNAVQAEYSADLLESAEDYAMDRGCFVVY